MINLLFFLLVQFNICNQYINIKDSNNFLKLKNYDAIYNSLNTSNMIEKKNIILGTIVGYPWQKILTFFNSLIQANFSNCDVVIFIKDVYNPIKNYLKNIGVILLPIPNIYPNMEITKLRWKLYKDYLEKNKDKYNLVFTTDIRDVFFQKDIFQYYKTYKPFLGVATEDNTLNQITNKMWITNFAGEEKHKTIQNKKIICFGTVWGSFDIFLEFSKILWGKIEFDKNSTDQGIGNYLIYYEKIFNDYIIKSDNYGPVITIWWNNMENIRIDSNNNILNFRGEVASVIHQYGRYFQIEMIIQEKFLYKMFDRFDNFANKNNLKINKSNNTLQTTKKILNDDYYLNIINILIIIQFLITLFLVKKLCKYKMNK